MARSFPVENLLPQNVVQLSTTCSNVLKQPNGELLVAVNHNQLQTKASETVDIIDWLHPPPSWAVPPECLVPSINQCNLSRNQTCNCSMRGNHLARAATQGIIKSYIIAEDTYQHLPGNLQKICQRKVHRNIKYPEIEGI